LLLQRPQVLHLRLLDGLVTAKLPLFHVFCYHFRQGS
jgi:hypothetical protein